MNRGLKQFVYGAGFLLFFSGVMFGVYSLVFKAAPTCFDAKQNGTETGVDCGGGCAPCGQKYARDIEVDSMVTFSSGDTRTVVVAYLKNPNDDFGFRDVIYTITAKDGSGATIGTASDHAFLYDRASKGGSYLIATIGAAKENIADISIVFTEPQVAAREDFIEPKVSVQRSTTDIVGLKKVTEPLFVFTRDLGMKTTGDEVQKLEEFLYQKQFLKKLPNGAFDLDTKLALTDYQKARKIAPANGIFDARTRTRVNAEIDRVTKFVIESNGSVTIGGTIKNNDIVNASRVVVTGLLYDATGIMIGGSKTEINDMQAAEEQAFKIVFPKTVPIDKIDTTRTRVFVDSIK